MKLPVGHVGVQLNGARMVLCVMIGCSKRSDRDKDVSFFRIPSVLTHLGKKDYELSKRRRDGFLAAISREDLTESILRNGRVCSRHFVSGKPADLYDETNPDWLPTLNLGHGKKRTVSGKASTERWERKKARTEAAARRKEEQVLHSTGTSFTTTVNAFVGCHTADVEESETVGGTVECSTQTELTSDSITDLEEGLSRYRCAVDDLTFRCRQIVLPLSEETMQSDECVVFYTGLPNFKTLKCVFDHTMQFIPSSESTKLTPFQEFVAVMIKLRLNCPSQDLAHRLSVSQATISRILLKWLTEMDNSLQRLIPWPDREALQKSMPECFQVSFGKKVAVILDCFEIFTERPSNLEARSYTWSSYKHHNTVKVLLGTTPQGVVSFVSDTWEGRTSDKYITEHCGILNKLLPGDVVLADRGFDIGDSVGMMQARLHIPAFTKGKSQLSAMEVQETREIANVRIHVERVIGNVRQKYSILQSTLPIHFLIKRVGEDIPLIDRIVRICCALCNVCDSVVPFD